MSTKYTPVTVRSLETKALVALYNELTSKNIKRFATRPKGEAQVLSALEKAGRLERNPKAAAGQVVSWTDPKVHAARIQKHKVTVNGEEFRSVHEACTLLEMAPKHTIKFRMALFASKEGELPHPQDGRLVFKLVPSSPKVKKSKKEQKAAQ